MTLDDAMLDACRVVGIKPPKRSPIPGRWMLADTYERNGKGDGRVLVFDDGRGGIVWNHQTQRSHRFAIHQPGDATEPQRPKRDPDKERRRQKEQRTVERVCVEIVRSCRQEPHPYLAAKGFPNELGLVHEDPRRNFPPGDLGDALAFALPVTSEPMLIVPGRIGGRITTVQFITAAGEKKNILRGIMGGASHRIATGRLPAVCEGIATALSVRAALRLLGASAAVLSAFSASNVAKVAQGIPGSIIAADHDKPVPTLGDLGAGEYYARQSGRRWLMPSEIEDWNDLHQREGLRAVALRLREIIPP